MFVIPLVILGLAVLGAAGFEAVTVGRGRAAARRQAIRDDPANFVRGQIHQATPRRRELARAITAANTRQSDAEARAADIAKNLPSNPPPRKWTVIILALSALWLVAFLVQLILDVRIARAITGQTGSSVLTALVVSGILSASTLAAALLWEHRASVGPRLLRLGMVVAVAVFFAVLSLIVFLAPKRAELDFAERIDTAKQAIVMYEEDNDATAADLERATLERLETERDQAADFYRLVAVIAGVLEGGTSFVVPAGYVLVNFFGAQALVRKRRDEVTKANAELARAGERFAARMARVLGRAGVPQDQLGTFLAGGPGEPLAGPTAPPQIGGAPTALPPAAPPPPAPEPPRRPRRPTNDPSPRETPPGRGPDNDTDPSFDQA